MNVRNTLAAPTFNLSVADNANYFVGEEMILTHDITKREPTRMRAGPIVKSPADNVDAVKTPDQLIAQLSEVTQLSS